VRRTALAAFPREQIAPLIGPAWLSFLDRSYSGEEFSHGVGRLLVSGPYQRMPPDGAELQSLVRLVRRWIRGHHA
jgi:Ca-activated chloride channel family protein